jgi:hypothetical protein
MKIHWPEKVIYKEVVERIKEKRKLLNNILRRKTDWIGHILTRNCLLHDFIEEQMTEVNGIERRRTKVLENILGDNGGK